MYFSKPKPEPRPLQRIAAAFRFDYLTDTGESAFAIYEGEGWTEAQARRNAGDQFRRDYPRLRKSAPSGAVQAPPTPAGVLAHERTG